MTFEQEIRQIACQQLHEMKQVAERASEQLHATAGQYGVSQKEVVIHFMRCIAEIAPSVMGAEMASQMIGDQCSPTVAPAMDREIRQRPPSHRKIMAGDTHPA